MENNVFTEGIEHGGLTTSFEVRMLVCWLLNKSKASINRTLLNEALASYALVNYFELSRAISDLKNTGHILEDNKGILKLTDLGKETAETFGSKAPFSVREKALFSLENILRKQAYARENQVTIEKREDGYYLNLQIADIKNDLLKLVLFVPNEEIAYKMREKFLNDPAEFYTYISKYLTE